MGVLINTLNAAEIAIYPELIHALASNEKEHDRIETLLNQITGYIVFSQDDGYSSHHPFWSAQYLKHALQRNERGSIYLFEQSLNEVFRLFDEAEKRAQVRRWCRGNVPYIDDIDDNPQFVSGSLLRDIFDLGQRHPSLSQYFGTTEQSRLQLPEVCSQEQISNCQIWRGRMWLDAGKRDRAETEFDQLIQRIDDTADISEKRRQDFMGSVQISLRVIFSVRTLLPTEIRQ